jgi:membrane protease YdiL (CAAX protease family)
MATSGLIVAAIALPVAILARASRPRGEPLLPPWKPWRVPWNGFEVIGAFVLVELLRAVFLEGLTDRGFYQWVYGSDFPRPRAEGVAPERLQEAATLRMLWASLFALPPALALLWLAVRLQHRDSTFAFAGRGSLPGRVCLAVAVWVVIAPVVLAFNAAVNETFKYFGVPPEEHSLTKLGGRPLLDQSLFVLQACLGAPLMEELLFRGVLLSWCVGRTKFVEAGVAPGTAARPLFVTGAAIVFAFLLGGGRVAPLAFACLLTAGLGAVWHFARVGARRARAVYATAALFAVMHSGVWPNPIPLFVLGLALGWLAVRTNGILVPVIVHGLFNAVSTVLILRG